jgi:peptidoglycan biosynthesis protein MviN/MurJ (putative lipid II flippase)
LLVWCLAFGYAAFLAVTLQKLILPLLPGLHAGQGLLQHDAMHFHTIASELAQRIGEVGWSEWRLFPAPGATGNVGLLAALYAAFGPDPAWFIPFNAAAHATGALMLYLIGPLLWPGQIGRLGGLAATILFLAFPSSLSWYAQNHKDAFSIAGLLILLFVWLQNAAAGADGGRTWRHILLAGLGVALIAFVRPYFLTVVAFALLCSWLALALVAVLRRDLGAQWRSLTSGALLVALVSATAATTPDEGGRSEFSFEAAPATWGWHPTPWLPQSADHLLETASKTRAALIDYSISVEAGSLLDRNRKPDSAASAVAYMPRALAIALFSPFPDSWTERMSLFRVVGALETLVWYLLMPGVLLLLLLRPSQALLGGALFCAVILAILGYVHANVGTLYRQRFGLLFFFILCGAIGWARVVIAGLSAASRKGGTGEQLRPAEPGTSAPALPDMTRVAASGVIVIGISFIWYLGFLVRDLLLLRNFGMNRELDALFSAAMVPMFFVTFLAMPFADAVTLPFVRQTGLDAARRCAPLARAMLSFASTILLVAGLAVIAWARPLVTIVMNSAPEPEIAAATEMLRWLSLLLICSGWTIIGNSLLNALHQTRAAALAQLPTPAIAILAILLFVDSMGPYAAIFGMLTGMAINTLLVVLLLRTHGVRFAPGPVSRSPELLATVRNWGLLALAALVACAAVPINYSFAGSLGEGAISAWALGSKMIQFFTGLGGLAIGAVILPYLGAMVARGDRARLRNDLYFLLTGSTWISVLCVLVVWEFADPLVLAVFEGGKATSKEATQLADILELGSLQLPFVAAIMLILKFAAVSGTSFKAVVAMSLGLAANIALNVILVPQSGVLGIATAAAIGSALAASYLVLATRRHSGLRLTEVALLLAAWTALAGLCIALHYRSTAAAVATGIVLLVLAPIQWLTWRRESGAPAAQPAMSH